MEGLDIFPISVPTQNKRTVTMKNLVVIRVRRSLRKKRKNFYSKEESEDEEILFIGTTNSDDESEVDIEAQYMAGVDEI